MRGLFITPGHWLHGYGGKPWSLIAETLRRYEAKENSDTLFIDQAAQLEHNFSCVFDKWYVDYRIIRTILNAAAAGSINIILKFASPGVQRIYVNSIENKEQKQQIVKQFKIERCAI